MEFAGYLDDHARTLRAVFDEEDWREVVRSGGVEAARGKMLKPARTVNVFKLPVEQLTRMNEGTVRAMIAAGETDEQRLLAALGRWPTQWPEGVSVRLSFLGLNLGFACDMQPRCLYCNQQAIPTRLSEGDWVAIVRSVIPGDGEGPYIFITGGEPLLQGEALWGEEGLVRMVTAAGAACNINTNALALTPSVALALVAAGLSRVHISLDTHRPETQDAIMQQRGRWAQVVRGIHNLQIARALLGAEHPTIHINCVLTRMTADDFPGLLRFLLAMKPLASEAVGRDLDLHVIPVGGAGNEGLRLSAEEYQRFFTDTWERANAIWMEYQQARGVPEDKRGPLHEKVPYLSPFHRVKQTGDLAAWAATAAQGLPAGLALTQRCYVAPTQAFILPDGSQHWCGGHTTSRPGPIGNVLEHTVCETIRREVGQLAAIPNPYCRSCAGATLAINQSVEASLLGLIRQWLNPEPAPAEPETPDPAAFE